MAAGLLEDDDDERGFFEKHPRAESIAKLAIPIILLSLVFVSFLFGYISDSDFPPSEYWVKLRGVEGLERSVDAATAPTFHFTLRVNNEGRGSQVCGRGDAVDVAYEDVPLAHGQLPDFCVPPRAVGSVHVVAAGEGLGLPDELYERMERQRQRDERVSLAVHVRMREITGNRGSPLTLWCTAILHGQPEGPFLCQVFGQPHDILIPAV